MPNRSKNENHYTAANHVIKKLEFMSHVDRHIANAHNRGNKQAEMTLRILEAVQQRYANFMKDFLITVASAS